MSGKKECFGFYQENMEPARNCGLCAYRGACMGSTPYDPWLSHPGPDDIRLEKISAVKDRTKVVAHARELLRDPSGARWTDAWFDAAIALADSEDVGDSRLLGWLLHYAESGEEHTARRELDLRTLMLLSALESWAMSFREPLPEFMADELETVLKALKGEVLR